MSLNGTETHGDSVTMGELARLIERIGNDVERRTERISQETKDGFQAMNLRMDREQAVVDSRLAKTVSLDVYVSDKRADEERFKRIEADIASGRATTRWAVGLGASSILTIVGISIPVLLNSVGK